MDGTDILSVGIDIGTSTTQVIFSEIKMLNTAGYFSVPRVDIIDKRVIYKSDIYKTPLESNYLINAKAVSNIVKTEFDKAGFKPENTDTGAVIITGESARKENSAAVLDEMSGFAGDFVVSTAGPDLESVIAGKGSGAQKYSEDNSCVAVNMDIGGGTTNIAVFDSGRTVSKACYDIGGRQMRLDRDYRVEYISPSAAKIADSLGLDFAVGKVTSVENLKLLTAAMAKLLDESLGLSEKSSLLSEVKTHGSSEMFLNKKIDAVFFSGGVADCIYTPVHDALVFGDIGVYLGNAIRQSKIFGELLVIKSGETIRATVVGAGTYTASISGSTIAYSEKLLPLKNIPVLKLGEVEQKAFFDSNTELISKKLKWFSSQSDADIIAISLEGLRNPSFLQINKAAQCAVKSIDNVLGSNAPVIIIFENDTAKAFGQAVRRIDPERSIVAVDGIAVDDGDYMDFGKPLMNGLVIPVVVKTLIFG